MILLTPNGEYEFEGRDDSVDDRAVVKEIWVENVYQVFPDDVKDTGVVIDIGANIGSFSVYAASLGDDVMVYAFEPEQNNFDLLNKNIHSNKFSKQVITYPIAIGNKGWVEMDNKQGGSRASVTHNQNANAVPSITLDQLFSHIQKPYCDILKIDIEGGEFDLFDNTDTETLSKCNIITMEFHKSDPEALGRLLTKLSVSHNVHFFGSYKTGGNIYAKRY